MQTVRTVASPRFLERRMRGARMGPRAPHLAADGDLFFLCSFPLLCISPVPRLPRGSEAALPVKLGELAHIGSAEELRL